MFSSLPALSVFPKFGAKSSSFLSTSASQEGKSQVKAFHRPVLARKNERERNELFVSTCSVARALFSIWRGSHLNIRTLMV